MCGNRHSLLGQVSECVSSLVMRNKGEDHDSNVRSGRCKCERKGVSVCVRVFFFIYLFYL